METVIAKTAGFCFGVRRAVKMAEEAAAQGPCACLGPLIHNDDVVRALAEKGVRTVESVEELVPGEHVIIRSHGAGPEVYERLAAMGCPVIDATCPDVARIHRLVREKRGQGREVLIIGQREHPEVQAVAAFGGGARVLEGPEDTEKWLAEHPETAQKPLTVVSQTTGERKSFENCVKILKKQCTNLEVFDTICNTTSNRQAEARKIAAEVDAMIVIGGRHSANTAKLAKVAAESCGRVLLIENASQLDPEALRGARRVGVTAGASTPEWIIKEVNRKMCDENKTVETVEEVPVAAEAVVENAVQEAEAPAAEPVQTAPEAPEGEASFEELLERSIKTLHTGEKVRGVIASITQTEISVDLGTKQSGYIPISEFTDEPGVNVADAIHVGDEIEAYVMRVNDVEGTVMLSKKRLDSAKNWDSIVEARASRAILEGIVVEENKGGVVVNCKGVRVFVPASQSGLPKDAPMTELVKRKVKLVIREVNQPRKRVVGSIRDVAVMERRSKAEATWNEIEVGKRYHGTVKSLTSYGAFVDIGGVDGMVHVSELSWKRIHQPSDVLKVGDEIDVYVISFDKETKKISLGYKDPNENPWVKFTTNYAVGSVAEVRIVKLMTFGAFAEIVPGVDGLIHISQIADRRIGKPEDVLAEGDIVKAKIINIDNENKKVSLSIRALSQADVAAPAQPEPEEDEDDAPAVVYDTENPPAPEDMPQE